MIIYEGHEFLISVHKIEYCFLHNMISKLKIFCHVKNINIPSCKLQTSSTVSTFKEIK